MGTCQCAEKSRIDDLLIDSQMYNLKSFKSTEYLKSTQNVDTSVNLKIKDTEITFQNPKKTNKLL